MNLFKRKPKEETVRRAEHERKLAEKDFIIAGYEEGKKNLIRSIDDATETGKDEGAAYVLSSLASALHVDDWSFRNGSETWEGDVWATMFHILVDAGVVEEDHHQVATFAEIAAIRAERDELLPDALAHRARLKRDREYHANRRQSRDKQQAEVGA